MRKGRFLKYLLAAIVAIGTSFNAMAQDLGKVTITFQEKSGSYCNHLNVWDWGGTKHQAPTPIYTPSTLGLEISEYKSVHNNSDGAYIGWERGTIYFKNTFKYQVRAVEWDISRGGLFDMRGQTWFGDPSEVEGQDYTIDNKTDDSNSKVYTSANDRFLDQISLNTQSWSGGAMDLFHLKLRKLVIYYYKPEVIVSLSNIKDSEGNAYTLQNGKDMSVGSTGTLSASLGTKHVGHFGADDVTFKYYSENSNIATINETTGVVNARASGSVVLTAKMYDKSGNEVSDASYVLFVFEKNEGMVWTRNNVSVYHNNTGVNSWSMSNTLTPGSDDWKASGSLKGGSLIWDIESGESGVYREFASFNVPGNALYRTIAQNISCTVSLPKYSSMDYKPTIAGSLMTEDVIEYGVRYGLEAVDLGKQNNSTSITWNTNSVANNTTSVGRYRTGSTPYTMLRGGAENNKEENKLFGFINIIKDANDNYLPLVGDSYQVGSNNNNSAIWKGDNKNGASIQEVTYNLAVMSYLWGSTIKNYPASSLFGYSGVPEYTYYAHVSFYNNYKDDEAADFIDRVTLASRGRNVAAKLSHSTFVPNREGYTFKGWSTVKGATTIEYEDQGDFYCFDPENGGGKGEIKLYAVWQPNTYTVTLNRAGGSGGTTSVTATFDEPLPSGDDVKAPTKYGYTFGGYFTGQNGAGTMYYDNSMTGIKNWDIAANTNLYAKWTANVCKVELRPNGTGAVAGTPYVMVTHGQKFPEEVDGHAVTPPTRKGYIFNGFYQMYQNNKTYFYDKDMKTASCANWPYQADYEVLADWIPKTTKITFNRGGAPDKMDWGGDNGTSSVTATYDANMPDMIPPSRAGYEFMGYFDAKTGGKQYYYTGVKWDKDVEEATLYAHWRAKTVKVIFNYTDPSKNILAPNKEVTGYTNGATNHSSLSGTGVTAPMYEDYLFDGWYEQDGKNKTYDAEGNAVEGKYWVKNSDGVLVWQSDNDVNLYPLWIKDATTVEIAEIRLNNYEGDATHNYVGVSVSGMTTISNFRGKGYITVDGINFLSYIKNGKEDQLQSVSLEEAPVWTIESVEGMIDQVWIYTDNTTDGHRKYLSYKIENGSHVQDALAIEDVYEGQHPRLYFTIYNEKGWICLDENVGKQYNHVLYMKDNTNWEYEQTGDNQQYKPIRILAYGSSSSYGDLNSSKVISKIKEKLSTPVKVNGKDTYPYAYNGKVDSELCKGILYVDMGGAASVLEANANELSNFKKEVSANCLFFMPSNYTKTSLGNNVVCFDGTSYTSLTNLVITDKIPFSSPYRFYVGNGRKASYHRDYSYKWGSLFLPFPAKRIDGMKYYKLYGSDNLRLAFQYMDGNDDIPANTPVACYGNGTFTLENQNIDIPADSEVEYSHDVTALSCDNIQDYVDNNQHGTSSQEQWNFKGVRFATYVYGQKNNEVLPKYAEKSLVYYFANDEFRYVNPEGRVKFAPFRAYLQAPEGSNAKTFSLLVFDEEGATDITDIIDGNAGVANGKIYDLLGRRVKTPLKGHIYIVDGKKKQY